MPCYMAHILISHATCLVGPYYRPNTCCPQVPSIYLHSRWMAHAVVITTYAACRPFLRLRRLGTWARAVRTRREETMYRFLYMPFLWGVGQPATAGGRFP